MNDAPSLSGPLRLRRGDDHLVVIGRTCPEGHYVTAFRDFTCPDCGARLVDGSYGPRGVVWSYTTITTPAPGRTPPFMLAYVDLESGPRILADVPTGLWDSLEVGDRVLLVERDARPAIVKEVAR